THDVWITADTRYALSTALFLLDAPTPAPPTLSLHDALPICSSSSTSSPPASRWLFARGSPSTRTWPSSRRRSAAAREPISVAVRSEEHTSELQSRENLVCRLLLEKKKKKNII